ncbi:MAG: amino acid adenylation domain-containing protein [Cyanobacteria bacterium P01_E01_bin.42]
MASPLSLDILDRSIPQQFQAQVLRHGDRPAIQDEKRSLTYKELNGLTNQIAREILERRGVGAEPIAVLLATGIEAIATMFGVLKTGKFYIPLDITWPESRLAIILEDSQSQLIVSDRQQAIDLDLEGFQTEIFWLDDRDRQLSSDNLEIQSSPEDLADIIYTSGSSGRPKGVMQTHRYLINLSRNYSKSGEIKASDRFSLVSSVAFGGAVRDIYSALLNGAALFPLDVKQIGLHQLGSWLQDKEITVMFAVATLFRHFAATLKGRDNLPALRLIQIASETIYRQDIELFQQHFSDRCTLMVNLGATEVSPIRQFPVTRATVLPSNTISAGYAGYAVEGVEVLLWDEFGREVPSGEVGEIVVRSLILTSGYWQRPELNQKVFIRDGNFTYFKTGDLGRFLSDGFLFHLGRKDFQVKIRGYRVEIGEIESILLDLEAVREAVVVAQTDGEERVSDRRLVAFLTPKNPQNKPDSQYLKESLAKRLPEYAIPSTFAWLNSLPLTATGKVDRRSLPQLPRLSSANLAIVLPQTPTEEKLARIWSEVLKLPEIGRKNNLFELGGNSLHASQILVRVSEQFGIDLPLKTIFDAPTIAQFAVYLESAQTGTTLPPLEPAPKSEKIPLSLSQKRLWFLDSLEQNKSIYNLLRGFRLLGKPDRVCLEQALQAIVTRHDILRTTFPEREGIPQQEIASSFSVHLNIVDLQDLASEQQNLKIRGIIAEMQGFEFNLTCLPLFNFVLIHLSDREHYFLFSFHHIITDDWSVQVFLKELSLLYESYLQNKPAPLSSLPVQYADYTHWQQQYLTGEAMEKQLEYWRSQLTDIPSLLELPTDFSRTSIAAFQSGIIPLNIDRETTQKLQALSRRSQTTLFVTLLTAFSILLSRYSNQEDIVVGTGIANRNPVVTEQLIGFFVSTLALRIKLADNPTFLHLCDRVAQTVLNAHAHGNVPFDRIVESLKIERYPNDCPIFQVLFILQNISQETLLFPDIETGVIDLNKPTAGANFDLTLSLQEREGELFGKLEYNANLFTSKTIAGMADCFRILVEAIADRPEEKLAHYPLLSPEEQHKILVEWNRTESEYPRHACIQALFEEQVAQNPEAIALIFQTETLTYQELNQKANRLAHYLQTLGVGNESLVGVCLERSPQLIIALLGIIKAGGAYLPLDPTYPSDRLALMVKDADVEIILSETSLRNHLPKVPYSLDLEERAEEIAQYSPENAIAATPATSLAYVMYTSGSTGKPKGVSVTHRNILRLVKNTNYISFNTDDTFLQLASPSFDAATWEIWGSLLNGVRLVLFPERQPSLVTLGRILRQHRVTALFLTTRLFQLIIDERLKDLQPLRLLLTGGEVSSTAHLEKCRQVLQHCQLVHVYGPTENTTFTSYYPILSKRERVESIPIGRPIANTRVYILDPQKQPVPIGVAGELYTGGDGVARGYLNRPELNAERFIKSPFVEGDRLYKTGDLARYLPDGNIEFLGRIDRQVKIRGFRIEPGEIEAVLCQHPQVKQAIAIVQENDIGDKSIVVYAIAKKISFKLEELRHFLQQQLPHYLQPSAIAVLERFPLTTNGKINFRALPDPDLEQKREKEFIAPRTPTEIAIANIFALVLKQERVGIEDNFFHLGGHSLLASQAISRLCQHFDLEIPLKLLFEQPILEDLARSVDAMRSDRQTALPLIPPILPRSISQETKIPLSFAQEDIWLDLQNNPDPSIYNSGVNLRFAETLSPEILTRSINEIIKRHEILRTTFPLVEDRPVQAIVPDMKLSLKIVRLQDIPPTEREAEALKITRRERKQPFDLTLSPLIRIVLLQLSSAENWLLISMHHIITDGGSIDIFLQELETLYLAFSRGLPSPLPEVPLQYADFTLWQQQRLKAGNLQKQHDYWLKKLIPPQQQQKQSEKESQTQLTNCRASDYSLVLKKNLVASLKNLSRNQNFTLSTIIFASLKILLFKCSSQREILVMATIGNRINSDIEKMLGCFINDVILRSEVDEQQTGLEFLDRVRETLEEAISNQEIPFHKIKKSVKSKRQLILSASVAIEPPSEGFKQMSGWRFSPQQTKTELWTQEIPLEIYISSLSRDSETIAIKTVYSTDLFPGDAIKKLFDDYQDILQKLADSPERKIGSW